MAILKSQKSFNEQLNDIQSIFQTAKTKALSLATTMFEEKTAKKAAIEKLNAEIIAISEVEARAAAFIQTLEQFTK